MLGSIEDIKFCQWIALDLKTASFNILMVMSVLLLVSLDDIFFLLLATFLALISRKDKLRNYYRIILVNYLICGTSS
jgi:hypothetical protein